jgi:hypothetical protein
MSWPGDLCKRLPLATISPRALPVAYALGNSHSVSGQRRSPRGRFAALVVAVGLAAALSCSGEPIDEARIAQCTEATNSAFKERIEPLLVDDQPNTCNQCHLSGLDLSVFLRPTPCESMACLVGQGLVNLADPQSSKILTWITRADPASELITAEVIQAERDAFLEWIQTTADCEGAACRGARCGSPSADQTCADQDPPEVPLEIGEVGCDDMSLEQLFKDTVYDWRGRCFPCHFSNQLNADKAAPRWVRVEGNCEAGAVETLGVIVDRGLLNLDDPSQSLLLLKPLAIAYGGVPHGGSEKFADKTDPAYVSFLSFIEHYAACAAATPAP